MNTSICIAILNYLKPLEEVNKTRKEHLDFISSYISIGKLIAAGRRTPPTGGVIISGNITKDEFKDILVNDPYYINGLAEHTIVEFTPGIYTEEFKNFFYKL